MALGHQRALAKSLAIDDVPLMADHDDRAGNLVRLDRGFDDQ